MRRRIHHRILRGALLLATLPLVCAQGPDNVLVVTNANSSLSRDITEYYVAKRKIPAGNVCRIRTPEAEEILRADYGRLIAEPVAACLQKGRLVEKVLYIATTAGVPLRISGSSGLKGDVAAVDSELALLYQDIWNGKPHEAGGWLPNPLFGRVQAAFNHKDFPIYLVTRLAAYDLAGVKRMIDQGLSAKNRGKVVLDQSNDDDATGNNWLRDALLRLPAERATFDASTNVLYKQLNVIGLASWGSNDKNRHERFLGFQWLPGAIATGYVSSDGRTFLRPPKDWNISDWTAASRPKWFAGSPQSMAADYLQEGASAATGHVAEPYLQATPRPQYLFPAYLGGRNLAESFYLSIPYLSWQNIVAGDPLMRLQ